MKATCWKIHSTLLYIPLCTIVFAQRACSGSAEGDHMFFLYSLYFPAGRRVCDRGMQYCVIFAVFNANEFQLLTLDSFGSRHQSLKDLLNGRSHLRYIG